MSYAIFFAEFVHLFGISCNDFVVALVGYLIYVACLLGVHSIVDSFAVVFLEVVSSICLFVDLPEVVSHNL